MQISLWTVATVGVAHFLGLVTSLIALLRTRTAQGSVAWIVSLNTMPWVAVPLWWLFGRDRFEGYVSARRGEDRELDDLVQEAAEGILPYRVELPSERGGIRAVEGLARMALLGRNAVEILVDGEATFESLFAGMERAERSLLVQFYIVKDDEMGTRFQEIMLRKAAEGVTVRFLYDGAGCYKLPRSWLRRLEEGGVKVAGFRLGRSILVKGQINFRNHRKIVVVDGREGWVGGINVGEEYLGRNPKIGPWRDTHLRVEGPAALGLKLSFLEDWHWATHEVPELDWTPHPAPGGEDVPVLMVPSGPADPVETASLLMQHAIHSARHRFWIASPYFVPDEGVVAALKVARLRGVDVRLLVPTRTDNVVVTLAALSYVEAMLDAGIEVQRYEAGFMHGKAFLMDDAVVGVGTVNLDNRSFRLNFEITAVIVDEDTAARMEEIFEADFARSRPVTREELDALPLRTRLGSRAARLLAPIL